MCVCVSVCVKAILGHSLLSRLRCQCVRVSKRRGPLAEYNHARTHEHIAAGAPGTHGKSHAKERDNPRPGIFIKRRFFYYYIRKHSELLRVEFTSVRSTTEKCRHDTCRPLSKPLSGPKLVEITLSFRLCEIDLLDLLGV